MPAGTGSETADAGTAALERVGKASPSVSILSRVDRYRLGHPAVEVLADAPPLNVQSGHSEVLHQGSSCAALGPHP